MPGGLRTFQLAREHTKTCSRRTPVSDGQFCLHQGCPFYRYLTVLKEVWNEVLTYLFGCEIYFPTGISLCKINYENTRKICEICSRLTIKIPEGCR